MFDPFRQPTLVTGASGLLGHVLAMDIGSIGQVIGVTHRNPLSTHGVRGVTADLSEPSQVAALISDLRPGLVINCAAVTRPEACETDADAAAALNAVLPGELARGCATHGARLVHISTDAVYGTAPAPYREDVTPEPISRYAQTKLAGEQAALAALPSALVLRVNFFGASAAGDRGLADFFLHALRAGQAVQGFTDVEFSPLYHRDLGDVVVRAVRRELSGVYNAGGTVALSKFDFGRAMADEYGFDVGLVRPGSRHDSDLTAARTDRLTMDSRRLASELGALPDAISGIARMHADESAGFARMLASDPATTPTR